MPEKRPIAKLAGKSERSSGAQDTREEQRRQSRRVSRSVVCLCVCADCRSHCVWRVTLLAVRVCVQHGLGHTDDCAVCSVERVVVVVGGWCVCVVVRGEPGGQVRVPYNILQL